MRDRDGGSEAIFEAFQDLEKRDEGLAQLQEHINNMRLLTRSVGKEPFIRY